MMTSMRKSMNRHSTEVWEMVGSMGDMMDYKELLGMMCRMEKFRVRGLCSNMESGVREMKFEMRELYSNFLADGRRPQFFGKWKTTSIFWKMGNDLNFLVNKRQPKFVLGKSKTTSI
jgi:hypothetical protein